tara:strand:+ start:17185 stop:18126 length:942 start_codon:yes stop_codon:yes gene_type:complete
MKILISGVSSFIGYNLSVYLSENYKIIGTLSKNFNDYRGIRYKRLSDLKKNRVNLLKFNFSQKEIKNIFHKYKPDYIILNHAVTENASNINFDFEKSMIVNLKGIRLLFEYAKKYNVKKVILTSTNQEYYLTSRVLTEKSRYSPQSPYGLSKYIQSSISRVYSNYYGVKCISTKIFNPFGKLDNPKKLIPHVINNLVNNKVTNLSKCSQKRDFIGIEDICYAYKKILLIDQKEFYMDINITSGTAISVKTVLIKICKFLNKDQKLLNFDALPLNPFEPKVSYGSNEKINKFFKFNPILDKSLKKYLHIYINDK